jgi:hypothetical protein
MGSDYRPAYDVAELIGNKYPATNEFINKLLFIQQNQELPKKKTVCRSIRHALRKLLEGFFKIPLKKFKTGGTKVGLFKIRIFNPG